MPKQDFVFCGNFPVHSYHHWNTRSQSLALNGSILGKCCTRTSKSWARLMELGIEKREEISSDPHKSQIEYRINRRRGSVLKQSSKIARYWEGRIERQKSSVRSKVEHPFRIIKCLFGYSKAVYRGITKNLNRLHLLFGSANLLMCAWSGGLQR